MLPDVVDDFAMRNPTCKDLEPLFFSCYAFCNKLAGGLSAGVSTMTLQWVKLYIHLLFTSYLWILQFVLPPRRFVGYRAGACNHSEEVVTALIVLFSPVPIAFLLLGMFAFLFYPINERQASQ